MENSIAELGWLELPIGILERSLSTSMMLAVMTVRHTWFQTLCGRPFVSTSQCSASICFCPRNHPSRPKVGGQGWLVLLVGPLVWLAFIDAWVPSCSLCTNPKGMTRQEEMPRPCWTMMPGPQNPPHVAEQM